MPPDNPKRYYFPKNIRIAALGGCAYGSGNVRTNRRTKRHAIKYERGKNMGRNTFGKWSIGLLSAAIAVGATACGKKDSEDASQAPLNPNEPVQLTFWSPSATKDSFMDVFGNAVQKKYPNITFQVIEGKGTKLPELVAAGTPIDLIQASAPDVIFESGLESDLADLIEKYEYDLNELDPAVLEAMKQIGNGKIYGFPNGVATVALFYNKDLFERFGIPYPTNGMTWDQVYAVAQKMTRNEGGVQYLGFAELINYLVNANQLSQGFVDPTTGKATLNNDNWRTYIENFARFHRIPGNELAASPADAWQKEQRVAMYASQFGAAAMTNMTNAGLNWGVVSLPEMQGHAGVGPGVQIPLFYVTQTSKNRDWAFRAAAFLGSAEFQREAATKVGSIAALRDRSVMSDYAKEVPTIPADKKAAEAVPKTFAKPFQRTVYDTQASTELQAAYKEVAAGAKDANTALREAEERANKAIEGIKMK